MDIENIKENYSGKMLDYMIKTNDKEVEESRVSLRNCTQPEYTLLCERKIFESKIYDLNHRITELNESINEHKNKNNELAVDLHNFHDKLDIEVERKYRHKIEMLNNKHYADNTDQYETIKRLQSDKYSLTQLKDDMFSRIVSRDRNIHGLESEIMILKVENNKLKEQIESTFWNTTYKLSMKIFVPLCFMVGLGIGLSTLLAHEHPHPDNTKIVEPHNNINTPILGKLTGQYQLINLEGYIQSGNNEFQYRKLQSMKYKIITIDKVLSSGNSINIGYHDGLAIIGPNQWKYFKQLN